MLSTCLPLYLSWSVNDRHVTPAWLVTWSMHDEPWYHCMRAMWSVHDQPRNIHRSFLPFTPVPENGGSEGLGWSPRLPDSDTNNFQHNKILWTYLLNMNINHRHYVTFTLNWTPVSILQPYEATALGWRATALSFLGHHGQWEAAVPPSPGASTAHLHQCPVPPIIHLK